MTESLAPALPCPVHPGSVSAAGHGPWTCKDSCSPAPAVWAQLLPSLESDLLQDTHPELCSVAQPGWTQHLATCASEEGTLRVQHLHLCCKHFLCLGSCGYAFRRCLREHSVELNNVRSVLLRVFHSLAGRNTTRSPDLAVFQPGKWLLEAKRDLWRRNTNTKIFDFPVWSFILFCCSCTYWYPCKNRIKNHSTYKPAIYEVDIIEYSLQFHKILPHTYTMEV